MPLLSFGGVSLPASGRTGSQRERVQVVQSHINACFLRTLSPHGSPLNNALQRNQRSPSSNNPRSDTPRPCPFCGHGGFDKSAQSVCTGRNWLKAHDGPITAPWPVARIPHHAGAFLNGACHLVWCCMLDGTNKNDGFLVMARRKPQRYRGIARICSAALAEKTRFYVPDSVQHHTSAVLCSLEKTAALYTFMRSCKT